nr:hypothetical protein [Tanacetum cinerariifolium]
MCLYIDAKEHELGDLGEPTNYIAALLDPESGKWLNAMNNRVGARTRKRKESRRRADTKEREKKQKVKDNKETTELKQLMEIISDKEEVAIDAIPLAVKPPGIVDWKIYKEGKKSYYQIIRSDGKFQMYMFFSQMLTSFDREDLEDLYKLVKAKYGLTRRMEDLDLLLSGDLKTMFEPHA